MGKMKLFCIPHAGASAYYYLPEEAQVIHKDVAQFLDRTKRRKASIGNCFVRKNGVFLPVVREGSFRAFYMHDSRKEIYIDQEELLNCLKTDPERGIGYLEDTARDFMNLLAAQ